MKVFKISLPQTGPQWCAFDKLQDALDAVASDLEEHEIGMQVMIEVGEMTEEEFKSLREFEGW